MSQVSTSPLKSIPIAVVDKPGEKMLGNDKIALNRAGFDTTVPTLRKPSWIRVRLPQGNAVQQLKARLRENSLVTVCEEASCPNIHECFSKGTATLRRRIECTRCASGASAPTRFPHARTSMAWIFKDSVSPVVAFWNGARAQAADLFSKVPTD